MSNDLTKLDEFTTALEVMTSTELPVAPGLLPILKVTKQGNWAYGKEGIEPDEASVWAWNPLSMKHGYVLWGDTKEGELMAPITAKIPKIEDMPEPPPMLDSDGKQIKWQPQFSVLLLCVSGADEKEVVIYPTATAGGKDAFQKMTRALLDQLRAKKPPVPLVVLRTSSYPHKIKRYGVITKPEFEISGWVNQDATPEEIEAALA